MIERNPVVRSNAQPLVGEDWVPRHRKIVQQNANQYRRVAWMPVITHPLMPLFFFFFLIKLIVYSIINNFGI